jgi:hypothetical protein
MVKDFRFKLGEIVYLKTDSEQLTRIVTKVSMIGSSISDHITTYELSQGDENSEHYSSEIIKTKDTNLKLGI